ncbi:MAG TPA: hypothetical protein VER08_00880 [Pyrinomonadaceae bacterium]|nr:hypothetical protein [Pyrinomonadaceae bacterium]
MFQVKAAYDEQQEFGAALERARAFFTDVSNFARMMPGVERITTEAGGVVRWLIRADVPVIGSVRHAFAVVLTEDRPERVEWSPASEERKNFLRYSIVFQPRGASTLVRIAQRIEIRRQHGRELHMLAPLVGAARLSAELQKGVSEMMHTFLQRARTELDKP